MQNNELADQVTPVRKNKRYLRKRLLKYRYELILVIVFATAIWKIAFYVPWGTVPSVIPTFLATFLGVLFSFLLLGCSERRKARKAGAHALALIWLELRHNRETANDIERNLVFPDTKPANLEQVMRKTCALRKWTGELKDKSYYAAQESGAFFEIKGDEVYNSINSAYYDLYIIQQVFLAAELSFFHFKEEICRLQETGRKDFEESWKNLVEEHLDKCKKETATFLQDLEGAIGKSLEALKRYRVTTGERSRGI